jgi:hypothetical protein
MELAEEARLERDAALSAADGRWGPGREGLGAERPRARVSGSKRRRLERGLGEESVAGFRRGWQGCANRVQYN